MKEQHREPVTEQNQIEVRLYVTDFNCDPDEITRILGINPKRTWVKGERQVAGRVTLNSIYKENGWFIASTTSARDSTEGVVDEVLAVIAPKIDRFRELPPGTHIELRCIIYAYEYIPGIHLTPNQLSILASIGAHVDVDLYALMPDDKDHSVSIP